MATSAQRQKARQVRKVRTELDDLLDRQDELRAKIKSKRAELARVRGR